MMITIFTIKINTWEAEEVCVIDFIVAYLGCDISEVLVVINPSFLSFVRVWLFGVKIFSGEQSPLSLKVTQFVYTIEIHCLPNIRKKKMMCDWKVHWLKLKSRRTTARNFHVAYSLTSFYRDNFISSDNWAMKLVGSLCIRPCLQNRVISWTLHYDVFLPGSFFLNLVFAIISVVDLFDWFVLYTKSQIFDHSLKLYLVWKSLLSTFSAMSVNQKGQSKCREPG